MKHCSFIFWSTNDIKSKETSSAETVLIKDCKMPISVPKEISQINNTSFSAVYNRIAQVICKHTQTEAAEFLGVRQSSIAGAKRRQLVPNGWYLTILKKCYITPNWLITGEGVQYLVPSNKLHLP